MRVERSCNIPRCQDLTHEFSIRFFRKAIDTCFPVCYFVFTDDMSSADISRENMSMKNILSKNKLSKTS